jgi:hypothetical protein
VDHLEVDRLPARTIDREPVRSAQRQHCGRDYPKWTG